VPRGSAEEVGVISRLISGLSKAEAPIGQEVCKLGGGRNSFNLLKVHEQIGMAADVQRQPPDGGKGDCVRMPGDATLTPASGLKSPQRPCRCLQDTAVVLNPRTNPRSTLGSRGSRGWAAAQSLVRRAIIDGGAVKRASRSRLLSRENSRSRNQKGHSVPGARNHQPSVSQ